MPAVSLNAAVAALSRERVHAEDDDGCTVAAGVLFIYGAHPKRRPTATWTARRIREIYKRAALEDQVAGGLYECGPTCDVLQTATAALNSVSLSYHCYV